MKVSEYTDKYLTDWNIFSERDIYNGESLSLTKNPLRKLRFILLSLRKIKCKKINVSNIWNINADLFMFGSGNYWNELTSR